MGEVRAFVEQDAASVAALFQRVFRGASGAAPASLASYFADVFLRSPSYDPEITAKVHVAAKGDISGFIGVVPLRMRHCGRPLRAAVAGSLMVGNPAEDPLAGARLFRAYLNGPQDLSISETANPVSHGMWLKQGGTAFPERSMEWLRVLRPASLAVALAGRRASVLNGARPLARALDGVTKRALREFAATPAGGAQRSVEATSAELASLVLQIASGYALQPAFDEGALSWILGQAIRKDRYGEPVMRIVEDRHGRVLGGYLMHARPGDIARVFQVFTTSSGASSVVQDLLLQADRLGAAAVSGRTSPEIMNALLAERAILAHRSATVARGAPELLAELREGRAFVNGVAGETWMRLIGDEFA